MISLPLQWVYELLQAYPTQHAVAQTRLTLPYDSAADLLSSRHTLF
jgi:hypothetical protein